MLWAWRSNRALRKGRHIMRLCYVRWGKIAWHSERVHTPLGKLRQVPKADWKTLHDAESRGLPVWRDQADIPPGKKDGRHRTVTSSMSERKCYEGVISRAADRIQPGTCLWMTCFPTSPTGAEREIQRRKIVHVTPTLRPSLSQIQK